MMSKSLADRIRKHISDNYNINSLDPDFEFDPMLDEVHALEAEVERLSKDVTQRGARMQLMRDALNNSTVEYLGELIGGWEYLVDLQPTAKSWFNAQGVPVRTEALQEKPDG